MRFRGQCRVGVSSRVLESVAPKREKELRRIQILLGLRAHKTELCLLALTLRIQYLKNTGVASAIALPGELEAAL